MTVAAIDCGTNSVRLLVADAAPDGGLADLDRRLILTRLGQGVDATGRFHPDALQRTLDAFAEYAAVIAEHRVERVRLVATSAARDASNRDEFFAGARERLGVDAEIISGDEEAALSFRGALTALPDVATPALVMDIGGGSTELVIGAGGTVPRIDHGLSLDIGSVRVRERFLAGDPPTAEQVARASDYIDSLLDSCGIPFGEVATWIGVGGTATSLSAVNQRLPEYDRVKVHGSTITRSDLAALTQRLLGAAVAQVRDLPSMHPKRADVICAGSLIADRVGRRVSVDLTVSESDILDGIALGLLGA
ncbi:MAG: Ppx/GppA phosphatase family protein [Micropruina sp.]|uniref:Ppx/GppA phosphatase family protein n=1 Tax=Micropruina sp. TaxID=2737536 RepID=UPI0039E3347C